MYGNKTYILIQSDFMSHRVSPHGAICVLMELGYKREFAINIAAEWLRERDNIPANVKIILTADDEAASCA